jgi:type VI secretion system secreted protein Hcp
MAVDIFLNIPKVSGESIDAQFAGQIDVVDWNWGLSNAGSAGTGTGSGTGKVNIQDLTLTKYVDKATPTLMAACCAGTAYDGPVILTMRRAGGTAPQPYLQVSLGNVTISGHQHATSSSDDRQTEKVSLHFATVQMQYTPQKSDGTSGAAVTSKWHIPKNTSQF